MTLRPQKIETFLFLAGWGQAERTPLAGDASNRRYERLTNPGGSRAVLMDAPPEKGEDIIPFTQIAQYLLRCDLSAPKIIARDAQNGFLLLEDLGDDLFARVLKNDPSLEGKLYASATDALLQLHGKPPPRDIPHYGPTEMANAACLALDWYAAHTARAPKEVDRQIFFVLIKTLLEDVFPESPVTTLRDYHAENLIWLPSRVGTRRVGLLDFQDAMLSHPAYDLASLLHDARRDVDEKTRRDCIARFLAATGQDQNRFELAYAACSAQRNLRIMGVFARLCIRDGKPSYPDLMPRVWRNLMNDLAHPGLSQLEDFVSKHLSAPTPDIIVKLKAHHG